MEFRHSNSFVTNDISFSGIVVEIMKMIDASSGRNFIDELVCFAFARNSESSSKKSTKKMKCIQWMELLSGSS